MNGKQFVFCKQIHVRAVIVFVNQGRRESAGQPPPIISWRKICFFPRKIGKHKTFTCEEHIRLECIYWTRHKWQKVDSFFWICYFRSKLIYHSYQQRVCNIRLLIRTFAKTKSNLMCGSFIIIIIIIIIIVNFILI